MRRVVAAVLLGAAVGVGAGGQSASADCLYPPVVQNPLEVDAAQIDPGPVAPSGSSYSQFGYGGLDVIRYEAKTCVAGVAPFGRPDPGVSETVYGVGKWIAAGVVAVTVSLAREVFGDGPLWQVVDGMFSPLFAAMPPQSFALLAAIIGVLSITAVVWRAREGDQLGWAVKRYATIGLIMLAGVACYTWTAVIPDVWGRTSAVSLSAVQDLTTGNAGAADVAVGDVFTDNVLMPMWARAQLGSDQAAIDAYAWRLRAASTLNRAETAQVQSGQVSFDDIRKAKEADYRKTAAELKQNYPASYAHLAGTDRTGQGMTGLLGAGVALAAAVVLAVALAMVAVGKVTAAAVTYGFPSVGPFFMWPRLHRFAAHLVVVLWDVAVASVGAVFVFVLWMLGPMRGLMAAPGASMTLRFVALGLVYVLLWLVWKLRHRITKKWAVREHAEEVRNQVEVVMKYVHSEDGHVRELETDDGEEPGDGEAETNASADAHVEQVNADASTDRIEDEPERERFITRVRDYLFEEMRPENPPVDDPDTATVDPDDAATDVARAADERAEHEQFRDRVAAQFDRMEEDELETRRAGDMPAQEVQEEVGSDVSAVVE